MCVGGGGGGGEGGGGKLGCAYNLPFYSGRSHMETNQSGFYLTHYTSFIYYQSIFQSVSWSLIKWFSS